MVGSMGKDIGRREMIKKNGDGSSQVKNWVLFALPLMALFLGWFGTWSVMKIQVPEIKTNLITEIAERKLQGAEMLEKHQELALKVGEGLATLLTEVRGMNDRLIRIENTQKLSLNNRK